MSRPIPTSVWACIQFEGESSDQFRRRSMLQDARDTWQEAAREIEEMAASRPWWEDFTPLGAT